MILRRSHSLGKVVDAPIDKVAMHTLLSSKRLDHNECYRLPPAVRPLAAAAFRVSEGLLAAAPLLVRSTPTISKERLDIVKILSEQLVLSQLTTCDKFGMDIAATAVAFGNVDCVGYLFMDRSLPHNQPVNLRLYSSDAYVSQDGTAEPRQVTVSLLHIAALRGDATIIRLLCRINPLSVNAVSSDGMTPLHYAIAVRGPLSSIDALLAHGADVGKSCSCSSSDGHVHSLNAFSLAGGVHSDALELLTMHMPISRKNVSRNVVESATEDDCDSDHDAKVMELSIFKAASAGNLAVISKALKHGFNVESRSDNGQTLLMIACSFGQRSIAKRVMKHGADMDATDADGKTAAHVALQNGKQEMCEYLLACGASKDLPDNSGITVSFLLANPESLASYVQQLHVTSASQKRLSSVFQSKQSACLILQRFTLDVSQSCRARCYFNHHGSCAASGRATSRKPWPKRASYVLDRHRRFYLSIVMLQCNLRSHQARCVWLPCLLFGMASRSLEFPIFA
jgi:ankyrin repeat protein